MLAQNALKQPIHHSVLDKLRDVGSVQRLVDIGAKRAEGKGVGYEKWAQGFNLQQMANTLNAYTEYGFASMDELNELLTAARSELQEGREKLKSIETVIVGKKELLKQLLTYWETKKVRQEYKALTTAKARAEYAQAHEREFKLSNAAAKYFKDHGITELPSTRALQAEIQQLVSEKNAWYKDYLRDSRTGLPRMNGRQRQRAVTLIWKLCSACDDGNCLYLDDGEEVPCPQTLSYSVCCKFFRWVLLKDKAGQELETEIFGKDATSGAPFAVRRFSPAPTGRNTATIAEP